MLFHHLYGAIIIMLICDITCKNYGGHQLSQLCKQIHKKKKVELSHHQPIVTTNQSNVTRFSVSQLLKIKTRHQTFRE
jgi:hypothetical protein